MEQSSSVRKEVAATAVSVDKIYTADYQKEGTKTAQLRQKVVTTSFYPTKQISNSHQDNIFELEEFGFEEQEYRNEENRVAWIDIPAIINSVDDVVAKLPADSCLYRVMSNKPIITDSQAYAVNQGLRTMDDFANSQIVRYGDNTPDAGKIVKDDNGKPQYRAIFFSKTAKADVDFRNNDAEDMYMSVQIRAELMGASTVPEQTI